jgi:hypothetical protein
VSAAIAKHRWAFSRNVLGSGMLRLPNASPALESIPKLGFLVKRYSKSRGRILVAPNKEKAPNEMKGASYTGCSTLLGIDCQSAAGGRSVPNPKHPSISCPTN